MDYLTAATKVSAQLAAVTSEQDPLVRAALDLAIQPWHDGGHTGADAMRWSSFATTIQAVSASWWSSPATLYIQADRAVPGPALDTAAMRLADAVAGVFARAAADPLSTVAWECAASAAEIGSAIAELEPAVAGNAP